MVAADDLITRTQIARALLPLIVFMILLIVIDSIVRIHTNLYVPFLNENEPTITFDGKTTYVSDNKLTFLIDNSGKGPTNSLTIYGLDTVRPDISSSDIRDTNGKTIKIDFGTFSATHQISLKVQSIAPGSYEGALFINKDTVVPITITTEPKVLQAIIWIMIGIITSIIIWEFIIHHKDPKKSSARYDQNKSPRLKNLIGDRRPRPGVALIDWGTIIFGISLGLLTVLNQGYVNTIRVIEIPDILAFFGTGLGIGSLREFAAKVTEPSDKLAKDEQSKSD